MLELFMALATWRLARMLAKEDGPFEVFQSLRNWAAQKAPTWVSMGLSCIACLSFWIGLLASWVLGGEVVLVVCRGLAFSAVAVILMRWVQ